jgi:hypothetical protein
LTTPGSAEESRGPIAVVDKLNSAWKVPTQCDPRDRICGCGNSEAILNSLRKSHAGGAGKSWGRVGSQSRNRSQSDPNKRYKDGPGPEGPGEKFAGCRLASVKAHMWRTGKPVLCQVEQVLVRRACSHQLRMLQDSTVIKPAIYHFGVDASEKSRAQFGQR